MSQANSFSLFPPGLSQNFLAFMVVAVVLAVFLIFYER